MELVGLRGRLKPGAADEYKAAHDAIPDDVIRAQLAAGVRRWLIFQDGLELFHMAECEDFARVAAELALDPSDQRWQAQVSQYKAAVGPSGELESRMQLIYSRQLWTPGGVV
jgi:L-rhamnose mutarotase